MDEWAKDHPHAMRLGTGSHAGSELRDVQKRRRARDPAISANVIIGLIKVATYLLDRQLRQLEKAFIEEGGFASA